MSQHSAIYDILCENSVFRNSFFEMFHTTLYFRDWKHFMAFFLMFMGPCIVIIWYVIPTRCTSHRLCDQFIQLELHTRFHGLLTLNFHSSNFFLFIKIMKCILICTFFPYGFTFKHTTLLGHYEIIQSLKNYGNNLTTM